MHNGIYSLSVHFSVDLSEPGEGWFVGTGQAVVTVDHRVLLLHYLIQHILPIPGGI